MCFCVKWHILYTVSTFRSISVLVHRISLECMRGIMSIWLSWNELNDGWSALKMNELLASKVHLHFFHFFNMRRGQITFYVKRHSPRRTASFLAFALICSLQFSACMTTISISHFAFANATKLPLVCFFSSSSSYFSVLCYKQLMQFQNNDYYSERGSFEKENYSYHL